ncbi:MAG TPA: prolyl oligopeptidase family serine peptidase [Casimicrobiaceae bacterium]|jgi:prolyl oligopeptidase
MRRTATAFRWTASAILVAASVALAQTPPAAPPVRDVTDTYFGVAVPDPYRYMEDMKNAEVAAWMKAQADYANGYFKRIPGRDELYSEIEKRGDAVAARVFSVQRVGDKVYYLKRLASENIPKLYVRDGYAGPERLLVDPELVKNDDGTHSSIDYYQPSPDNRYVATGISPAGSEASVLRIVDVATGKPLADTIDRAQYASPSWLPDGRLMYSRLQKLGPDAPITDKYQNQRVYVHTIGEDPDKDVALFGPGVSSRVKIDPTELVIAVWPAGSRYVAAVVINGVQRELRIHVAPVASLDGAKTPWTTVTTRDDDVNDFALAGDDLYLMSHKGTPRFKVLRTPLAKPDVATAQVALPAGTAVVTGIVAAGDAIYVRKMNAGMSELWRLPRATGKAERIALPYAGDIDSMSTDPRRRDIVFDYGGWTRSGAIYAYDPAAGKLVDTKLQPQGPYDAPANLESREVLVKAADGTSVPLSLVYKKGIKLDGSNPTILYGYGSYGISMTPFYRPTYLPWFDRGGVLAVAHVRGGGEYGEDWYKGGYKATKPNTWRDAIACAEWLVANQWTSSSKLSIMGGSAGGIFVGRAITDRPDLFGAAVAQVPVSDAVRAEFSSNGVPNIPEFGTVKSEEGFKALYAMSPYHWVKDGVKYPAVLLTTGINDPRVDAYQAAKMAARLQAASTSGKPVLLRIDYEAGHGFGTTKKQAYAERADTFAFLFREAGVKPFAP